jgi:hypothetical protein
MSQEQSTIVGSLKRQHHLLWLLLGLGFSIWLVFQLGPGALFSTLLLVALLATYWLAGQWAAHLIARSIQRYEASKQSEALMSSSLKTGVLLSLVSVLFHLVVLTIADNYGALELPFEIYVSILIRAAILPFLACLAASCTASDSAWPESAGVIGYPENSGLSTPTD